METLVYIALCIPAALGFYLGYWANKKAEKIMEEMEVKSTTEKIAQWMYDKPYSVTYNILCHALHSEEEDYKRFVQLQDPMIVEFTKNYFGIKEPVFSFVKKNRSEILARFNDLFFQPS